MIGQLIKELEEEKERNKEEGKRTMKAEKSQDFPLIIEEEPNFEKDKFLAKIAESDEEWSSTKGEKNSKPGKFDNQYKIVSVGKSKGHADWKKLREKNEELFRIAKAYEKKNKAYEK